MTPEEKALAIIAGDRKRNRPVETREERAARRRYEHALRRYNDDLERARLAFDAKMRDPDHCEAVGLPRELGEFATGVLAHTQALDKVGPRLPRRDRYAMK